MNAETLVTLDSCQLRCFYDQRYVPKSITPLRMLYAALEAGLIDSEPEQAAKDACMRLASTRELQVEHLNAFMTIRHIGYLAGIIAVALQDKLGILHRVASTPDWESGLFETRNGIRHRIELVSYLDDDRLRAAAHSWRVIGELAALEAPLTLTAVVIGAQRGGRRHSEWSKGLLHPVNKVLRFAPRNQKKAGFNDAWTKVWREQQSEIATEDWLTAMKADDVLDSLIISREIPYREDNRIATAKRDMRRAVEAIAGVSESSPMSRGACDDWGGCPFALCCWNPTPVSPGELPKLYSIRAQDTRPVKPTTHTYSADTAASWHPLPAGRRAPSLPAQ